MSRGASLASFLPWQYQPPSLPVSALLPWQYQPSFLASISVPSLPVPASFATSSFLSSTQSFPHEPPLCSTSLHPHPPVATGCSTTTSTTTQRRRSETRRAATSRSSSSEKRADRKGGHYAWGLRDTLRDTETRVYSRAAFRHQWESLRGHWVCGGHRNSSVRSSSVWASVRGTVWFMWML